MKIGRGSLRAAPFRRRQFGGSTRRMKRSRRRSSPGLEGKQEGFRVQHKFLGQSSDYERFVIRILLCYSPPHGTRYPAPWSISAPLVTLLGPQDRQNTLHTRLSVCKSSRTLPANMIPQCSEALLLILIASACLHHFAHGEASSRVNTPIACASDLTIL